MASTMSSYIPTNGSTVTRAAETMVIEPENNPLLTRGAELVENGDGSTVTGWNAQYSNTTLSSVAGSLRGTAGGVGAYGVSQALTTTIGETYLVQATVNFANASGGSANLRVASDEGLTAGSTTIGTTSDTYSSVFTAIADTTYIGVVDTAVSGAEYIEIDHVSVKSLTMPDALSIAMKGTMTYANEGNLMEVAQLSWTESATNYIQVYVDTRASRTGGQVFRQRDADTALDDVDGTSTYYSPGVNVPFNIASRHGATFINGAVDGTALTADPTPTALPDLITADLQIASTFMGNISQVVLYAADIGDTGLEEITS